MDLTLFLSCFFPFSAEDDSSSVANLQHLNLHNDDLEPPPEEDTPSVIIPNHLQVLTRDCSHLSFGSFGTGIGSAFSEAFASRPLKNNLDEVPEAADASSIGHSDNRYSLLKVILCLALLICSLQYW